MRATGSDLEFGAPAETSADESIDFTATSSVASSSFAFIEGMAQAASSQATFTSAVGAIDDGDEVIVIVTTPAGCSETVTLTMIENGVTGGTPTVATVSTTIFRVSPASITVPDLRSRHVSYRWQEVQQHYLYQYYGCIRFWPLDADHGNHSDDLLLTINDQHLERCSVWGRVPLR